MTTFGDPFSDWWGQQNPSKVSFVGDFGTTSQPPIPYEGQSWITDFLESEPEIPYQGALARANLTPNQMLTFRNQRENIFKQFQAQLDEQFRRGVMPSGTALDFLGNFNFDREFQRYGPNQRIGGTIGQFAPPIRYGSDRNR